METLADITETYTNPLTEESEIRLEYNTLPGSRQTVLDAKKKLDDRVLQKRAELGLLSTRTINLPTDKADALRQALKTDPEWLEGFKEIVNTLAPELHSEDIREMLTAIHLPWWNSTLIFREGETAYDASAPALTMAADFSHSYITQLLRSQRYTGVKGSPISISNVLLTADNLIILGLRGGHSFTNTIMTVPAGSIEYHSGENPFFETLYAEFFEETGLTRDDIRSAELIGETFPYIGKQPHYIFRSRTHRSFRELLEVWKGSADQREHKHLIALLDDPNYVLDMIKNNSYEPSKADPSNPARTTQENVGRILPQCASSILVHYIQREGKGWGAKAEELLDRRYRIRQE
ncbi:NUDIX hydrolase [Candidatus Woesearchaeota archaeon]|nr:NUDIX hydrolase [Candidatus Woesearchaeota archaeon]